MKKLYFLFAFFLFPAFITAQEIDEDIMLNRAVKGYIVFDNQDTTWGKVKVSTRTNNQIKVNFLADSTSKWITYKAKKNRIMAYGFATRENGQPRDTIYRWRHFKLKKADQPPAPFTSTTVFMECKVEGEVNLYSYYIQSNSKTEITYKHNYVIEQKFSIDIEEYRTRKVTRENFEVILLAFAEDCKKAEYIISIQPDYSNFDRVIEAYNECEKELIHKEQMMKAPRNE